MIFRLSIYFIALATLFALTACNRPASQNQPSMAKPSTYGSVPGPLPDNAFKGQLDLINPPARLRAGEKATIEVHVKNTSDMVWYARGAEKNASPSNQFYLAVGNRWLQSDGKLLTNMDGRYGIDRDLKPGEETTIPLQITAPKETGDYFLEVDLVQEQVAWFSDKGSPTTKAKISVVR